MHLFRRVFTTLITTLLILTTFAAPVSAETERLRMAITGDESTINPYTYVTGNPGWNMLLLQYDTLYQLDISGVPQPWLGEITAVSEDGLSVTVALRADVTWHDGEPFTAEDVVFTVDYFKQFTQSRFTRALRPIETSAVSGENEVTFTLTARTPSLELSVFSDVPVLPEHVWAEVDPTAEGTPDISLNVGTGPYQLVEYMPEEFYRFTAFADHWAGPPAASELVFVSYANITGALAANFSFIAKRWNLN